MLHSLAEIRHQGGALPEALDLFGEACALKRRIDIAPPLDGYPRLLWVRAG